MKITYDKTADAAYIYLTDIEAGGAARTETVNENINLDFDATGKLVGIEVLSASKILPESLLKYENSKN